MKYNKERVSYSLGKMFPACCTSSYSSTIEQPRLVSSLKKISNFLNSSNALISTHQPQKHDWEKDQTKLMKREVAKL